MFANIVCGVASRFNIFLLVNFSHKPFNENELDVCSGKYLFLQESHVLFANIVCFATRFSFNYFKNSFSIQIGGSKIAPP